MLALVSRTSYQGFTNGIWSTDEASFVQCLHISKKSGITRLWYLCISYQRQLESLPMEVSTCRLGMLERLGGKGYELISRAFPILISPHYSSMTLRSVCCLLRLWHLIRDSRFCRKTPHTFLLKFPEILLGISIRDASFVAPVHVKLCVTLLLRC